MLDIRGIVVIVRIWQRSRSILTGQIVHSWRIELPVVLIRIVTVETTAVSAVVFIERGAGAGQIMDLLRALQVGLSWISRELSRMPVVGIAGGSGHARRVVVVHVIVYGMEVSMKYIHL